jgi:hypothetical protein
MARRVEIFSAGCPVCVSGEALVREVTGGGLADRVRRLAVLLIAGTLFACGGGGGSGAPDDDPVLRPGDVVTVSKACREEFDADHMREDSGTPSAQAFLRSVQVCSTLAEWSSAAREAGAVRLRGHEAQFVNEVCTSAGDAVTQASPTCVQAKAEA